MVTLVQQMLDLHQRQSTAKTPQEKISLGRQIAASLLTPQGLALLIGVGFFVMLVIFVLFGAAGGAFSGWRHERRRQQS